MERLKVRDPFLVVYAYSMCIFVLAMVDVSWLNWILSLVMYIYICIISVLKLSRKTMPVTESEILLSGILLLYYVLSIIVWDVESDFVVIKNATRYFALLSVIFLPINEKVFLLKAITNCFVVILLISIPVWILYLVGLRLPHSGVIYHSNGFHEFYDYYFFRLSAKGFSVFPRFQSVFLEPGQMATPCAFLFFLNGANFSRKNLIFLIAVFLSFSLIAYGLVIFSFMAYRFLFATKYRVVKVLLSIFLVLGVSLYYSQDSVSDDPVSTLIVSRLEYSDDTIISGNNRLSREFRIRYDSFVNSDDRFWGIHSQLKKGYDWTTNSAGILKFIVHRGYIGLSVYLLFIFMLFWNKRSLTTFVWLMILITAFAVRDMLQTPLWCSIAIIGFYVLGWNSKANSMLVKDSQSILLKSL